MSDDDVEIASHIERHGSLVAKQVEKTGGWPKAFQFPELTTPTECEALRSVDS